MDKYLREEVGDRREITTSMVERADYKRNHARYKYLGDMAAQPYRYPVGLEQQEYHVLMRQQAETGLSFARMQYPGGITAQSLGSIFSSTRCPYCGR